MIKPSGLHRIILCVCQFAIFSHLILPTNAGHLGAGKGQIRYIRYLNVDRFTTALFCFLQSGRQFLQMFLQKLSGLLLIDSNHTGNALFLCPEGCSHLADAPAVKKKIYQTFLLFSTDNL